jgi:hypothetical protein
MSQDLPSQMSAKELTKSKNRLSRVASIEVSLLGLEFVLGMVLNLFVPFPSDGSLSGVAVISIAILVFHIVVAFVLLGLGFVLVALSAKSNNRSAILGSVVVMAGVIISFLGGVTFSFGGEDNLYSFVMAIGFLIAVVGTQRIRTATIG